MSLLFLQLKHEVTRSDQKVSPTRLKTRIYIQILNNGFQLKISARPRSYQWKFFTRFSQAPDQILISDFNYFPHGWKFKAWRIWELPTMRAVAAASLIDWLLSGALAGWRFWVMSKGVQVMKNNRSRLGRLLFWHTDRPTLAQISSSSPIAMSSTFCF
jgi:hypothetical protein